MRLAMPSAFVAIAIAGATFGATYHGTPTVVPTELTAQTETITRHLIPSTYKSWYIQEESIRVCKEMRSVGTRQWNECLTGHYEAKTGYELSQYEYTSKATTNSFKVSYSKITLPKGGKALKKAEKVAKGINTSVYCKAYTLSAGKQYNCSNGTMFTDNVN